MVRWKDNAWLAQGRLKFDAIRAEWKARFAAHRQMDGDTSVPSEDDKPAASAPEDIGEGEHIVKLLELAQRHKVTGDFDADESARDAIIKDWNVWVKAEREKDPKFHLDLSGFNGNAELWKQTPLWGKLWKGDKKEQLRLKGIDWSKADLEDANLEGADLWDADLEGACLWDAHLEGAFLVEAHLEGASLFGAHLENTLLEGAHLEGANLSDADLEGADLWGADFTRARGLNDREDWRNSDLTGTIFAHCDLSGGNFTGAILNKTDFTGADVSDIKYKHYQGIWPFRRNLMLGKYLGIRGVDSCYGDPGFRRDALDQDFIDDKYHDCEIVGKFKTIESKRFGWLLNARPVKILRAIRWAELPSRATRRFFFFLWGLSDYGRSIWGVVLFVAIIVGCFGWLYDAILIPHHHLEFAGQLKSNPNLPLASWYAAAMGAATLGLTDLLEPLDIWGEAAMFGNVLSGLSLFGMMVAVLQNKFARRS